MPLSARSRTLPRRERLSTGSKLFPVWIVPSAGRGDDPHARGGVSRYPVRHPPGADEDTSRSTRASRPSRYAARTER